MGGKALNGNKIIQEFVAPTFEAYSNQILSKIPNRGFCLLGSAGKKPISNDLDVGFDTSLDLEDVVDILDGLGITNSFNKGLKQIYTLFPIHGAEGKIRNQVQIDLMLGNLEWLKFSYWSPSAEVTQFTAHHRSVLLAAIVRYCRGIFASNTLVINWGPGIFEKTRTKYIGKDGTEKEKITGKNFVTNSPNDLVEILNQETHGEWILNDLYQPVEVLWEKTKSVFDPATLEEIKKYCIPAIQHRGVEYIVPEFLKEEI